MEIKKKFSLFIVLTVLANAQVSADFINRYEAEKTASEFFSRKQRAEYSASRQYPTGSISDNSSSVVLVYPGPETRGMASEQELPPFYIFNRTDNNGFVIVSAETGMRQILAYSDEGIFHTDQMDRGAKPFLDSYTQEVNDIRSGVNTGGTFTEAENPLFAEGSTILETANFDQSGYSFNDNYAPVIDGETCVSGCVATAMAIVMKYHEWPLRNSGKYNYISDSGIRLSFDFAANPFDWSAMSNTPDANSSDAISMLQKACGVAVRMNYGVTESGAYSGTVAYAMKHYFYYDYPAYITREYFDIQPWNGIMRSEIDAGRPVIVGGKSEAGGHEYVLDGYDNMGSFHYNFGWGGKNNGFYSDIYASSFASTDAIVGIAPRSNDEEDFTSTLCYASIRTTFDGNLGENCIFDFEAAQLENTSNETFYGMISTGIYDEKLNRKCTVSQIYDVSGNPLKSGWYRDSFKTTYCYIPESVDIEPTDMILLSTSADGGETWKPIYSKNPAFPVRHIGGFDNDAPRLSQIMISTDSCGIEIDKDNISLEMPVTVNAKTTNSTTEAFDGDILLTICDTCDLSVAYILDSINIHLANSKRARKITFSDAIIPADLSLKPSYALALFTRSSGSDAVVPVYSNAYKKQFVMLSDLMDIPDGTGIRLMTPKETGIFTPDGRRVQENAVTHGLYLIQHEDGTVTKIYR